MKRKLVVLFAALAMALGAGGCAKKQDGGAQGESVQAQNEPAQSVASSVQASASQDSQPKLAGEQPVVKKPAEIGTSLSEDVWAGTAEYDFGDDFFEIKSQSNKQKTLVYNGKNECKIELEISPEFGIMKKLSEIAYSLTFEALGEQQFFVYTVPSNELEELFFDMPFEAAASFVDYEHKVIVGHTWNSDKGLMPNDHVRAYLFSTARQEHYKIDELQGKWFVAERSGGTEFTYKNQDDETVLFDYSEYAAAPRPYSLAGFHRAVDMEASCLYILSDTEAKIEVNDINGNFVKDQFVSYKLEHIDGMPFLRFSEAIDNLALQDNLRGKSVSGDDKILFLSCIDKRAIAYRHPTKTFISYTRGFEYSKGQFTNALANFEGSMRIYRDCTSFLSEGGKSYPVENLCSLADSTPWVEGVAGDGIGESFVITNPWSKVWTTLLIMNGYISYEKPYLYKQNGRIKQIEVTGMKSGKSKVLDVLDTPHPQTVDISFITENEDLKITIVDVYKGTKYDDTCIHYLITWDAEVVPYETSIE